MTNGTVSGLYVWTSSSPPLPPAAGPLPASQLASPFTREELRLDVDGLYPQKVLSGTCTVGLTTRVEWIADLAPLDGTRWAGNIWHKAGDAARLPHAAVEARVEPDALTGARRLVVTYRGGGIADRTAVYTLASRAFRRFEVEIDVVKGATRVTSIGTGAHPNCPADLPREDLSVEEVFRRAGFDVRQSEDSDELPLERAHDNKTWDDAELHDAMQEYWSRSADAPRWALWVLFAARHDQGRGLAGKMFDDIGPTQRQGLAVFTDSFVARPPAGEASRDAWIARMRLFTLVHEMGHAFNMAHSWQKSAGVQWMHLADDPAARSFMNYPSRVTGGERSFFADFRFRFTDAELLFLRHAPERLVELGGAGWFDDHGFRLAPVSERPAFELELRIRPERAVFDFLEPIVLELKLSNVSGRAQRIPCDALCASERMTVITKRHGQGARQWTPFARTCAQPETERIAAKDARYESLFLSAGRSGWNLAEPGVYEVQVALDLGDEAIVSKALRLKVAPPETREQEVLAQDYFSDEVGRVLAMDGSRFLEGANNTLHELAGQFAESKAAFHARVALEVPRTKRFKQVGFDSRKVTAIPAEERRSEMDAALIRNAGKAMETLGHIDFNYYVQSYCDRLLDWDDPRGARARLGKLLQTLSASRTLDGRPVAKSVLDAITGRVPEIEAARARAAKKQARSQRSRSASSNATGKRAKSRKARSRTRSAQRK